jgi:hypothetical protein
MSNGWFGVLWGATPAVGIGRLFGVKAWLCEIKQVFRQLLQLLNVQGREYFAAVLIEAHKTSAELGHGQRNGFLLLTRLQSLLPSLLQNLLHRAGMAQFLQRQPGEHHNFLRTQQCKPLQ